MINAPDYHRATNAAYELLIQQSSLEIPISLSSILHQYQNKIWLKTYSQMAARFSLTVKDYKEIAPSEYGFTMTNSNKSYILYNDEKGYLTNRFTIAHELGHIMLNHSVDDSIARREANCFARNLLCPIPMIDTLNLKCIYDYVNWFHVSDLMAEYSINHLSSDLYYIENRLYGMVDNLIYKFMTGESPASAYEYGYYG